MKFVRYDRGTEQGRWGVVDGTVVEELSASPLHPYEKTGRRYPIESVRLRAPVENPSKIVCFGKNYGEHVLEMGWQMPREPVMFLKPPSAIIGHDDTIVLPSASHHVEPEGELALIIGKPGRHIPSEAALDHVFGYTVGNDVSARDLMATDAQWTRAKGFDSFLPLGPHIVTDIDPTALSIRTVLDGSECQAGTTSDMILPVPELIAMCSQAFTLNVGDVIMTGSPAGRHRLADGQTVQVTIDSIGTLSNTVRAELL